MGNSQSAQYPATHQSSQAQGPKRKRSVAFSQLTSAGCTSTSYAYEPYQSQETFINNQNEKSLAPSYLQGSEDACDTSLPPPLYDEKLSSASLVQDDFSLAEKSFLKKYPEYKLTWLLDSLRRSDFTRLDRTGEVYVDYMGGSLYPESLVRLHTAFLNRSVLGNTHSVNKSSQLSAKCADDAREAVLAFFRAPPEYTVIFTANASGALKLVGESFPFTENGSFVLGADSHNSVHGIRQFATRKGSQVVYVESTPQGGLDESFTKAVLMTHRPRSRNKSSALFALTGASNVSNSKNSLGLLKYANTLGYHTLLDAAALAPSTLISLWDTPVDAMAISFYKMFGFPTGVGALVVKKSFLAQLKRPWFAGGTVDVVQVPGTLVTMASELREQFEIPKDGTINYASLPAITDGLQLLSAYMPFLPLRLSCLMDYLITSLSTIRHDYTGAPVVKILSRKPARRLKSIGEQSDTGSTVSLVFLSSSGEMIPNSFVEYAATRSNISLRVGCMCNPGGAAAILGVAEDMTQLYEGVTLKAFEKLVGRELGVVRISLGLASNFSDVWHVVRFVEDVLSCRKVRREFWEQWVQGSGAKQSMPGGNGEVGRAL